jgi:hypothetical protein
MCLRRDAFPILIQCLLNSCKCFLLSLAINSVYPGKFRSFLFLNIFSLSLASNASATSGVGQNISQFVFHFWISIFRVSSFPKETFWQASLRFDWNLRDKIMNYLGFESRKWTIPLLFEKINRVQPDFISIFIVAVKPRLYHISLTCMAFLLSRVFHLKVSISRLGE